MITCMREGNEMKRGGEVKKILLSVAVFIGLALLMILPGFVLYIVGDIVNKIIPDKKECK